MNVKKLFDLTGRVVIVTGGAGIYGTPISEALAEAGAHVIVASRDLKKCEEFARQLIGKGLKASGESFDQSDEKSILDFHKKVSDKFGFVDVLVNNSVARTMDSFDDTLESWRKSMAVNCDGVFAISRVFLNSMMEKGRGSIINIGSIQGVVAPDFNNYKGTDMKTAPDYHFHKHGLVGLTKYFAAMGGPKNVRVNIISPGGFFTGTQKEPFLSQYCRRVFLGRMAEHDDIKGTIVLLASDASRYITGQNIIIDGGYTC